MSFPQWEAGQASPEVPVNEAFDILKFLSVYGRDPETTSGLTWGYLGGFWNTGLISPGTVSLTASNTNYIVINKSNGIVSASTSDTNWNNTSTYARAYLVNTSSVTVSSFVDYRGLPNGVVGPRVVEVTGLPVGSDGDLLRYNGTTSEWENVTLEDVLPTATDGNTLIYNGTTNLWESISGSTEIIQALPVAVGDETTDLTTGTNKISFRMPYTMTLTKVKASVNSQPEDVDIIVDIKKNGTTIFSTPLSIDAYETTSETAATPAVLSTTTLEDDSVITIDITQVGDTIAGTGLKIYFVGTVS